MRKPSQAALDARGLGFREGYNRARDEIAASERKAKAEAHLRQTQAVSALIEAATKTLSRAGYLIAQLNKEKG